MTGFEVKAVLVSLVIALGITAPVPDFLGGMIIALGCAYAVMIMSEPASRISMWSTLFLAFISALLFAVLHQHVSALANLPLQVVMGAAGGLSRFLTEATIGFGKSAKDRIADIPNNIKFPGGKE